MTDKNLNLKTVLKSVRAVQTKPEDIQTDRALKRHGVSSFFRKLVVGIQRADRGKLEVFKELIPVFGDVVDIATELDKEFTQTDESKKHPVEHEHQGPIKLPQANALENPIPHRGVVYTYIPPNLANPRGNDNMVAVS